MAPHGHLRRDFFPTLHRATHTIAQNHTHTHTLIFNPRLCEDMSSVLCRPSPIKTAESSNHKNNNNANIFEDYLAAMAVTGQPCAKWASTRSQNGVSLSLPRVTSTTKCVSCERRLDCQRLKIYCVSPTIAVPKPGHTNLSSQRNAPHPLVPDPAQLLAQEARQGLILISLALRNDIRGGLKIVVGDYGRQKR